MPEIPTALDLARNRTAIVGLIACLLLVGCAQGTTTRQNSVDRAVFEVSLQSLQDRYVDDFETEPTILAGLANLAHLDPELHIGQSPHRINILKRDLVIASAELPTESSAKFWANTATELIKETKGHSSELARAEPEDIRKAVFGGIFGSLDQYSRYFSPDVARRIRASRDGFGGIGTVLHVIDGGFFLKEVLPASPAAESGLRAGDEIMSVAGIGLENKTRADVVKLIRGKIGKPVRLEISRGDGTENLFFDVTRKQIAPPSIRVSMRDQILEIRVATFNQNTANDLRRVISAALADTNGKPSGLIFDLRNNTGGLLDQAVRVADLFIENGKIVSTKGRHKDSDQTFNASAETVLKGVPIIVLINGRSASAAEIVAAALRDHGRAAIVGSTSYGKGSVQTVIRLPNGGDVHITWSRLIAPSGQMLEEQGVVPAICTNGNALPLVRQYGEEFLQHFPNGLVAYRKSPHFSREGYMACPPSENEPATDRLIALKLLKNNDLYESTLVRLPPEIQK